MRETGGQPSGPAADLVVRARRIVTPGGEISGDVVVADGRIVAVIERSAAAMPGALDPVAGVPAHEVLDVPDDYVLLPGLVDTHVHVNEPGRSDWEGFATATAAAAAGGVTTIVDMPLNSIPATVDRVALQAKQASARDQVRIDVAFWGGAVPGNLADLEQLHDAGVVGFKCFLLPSGVDEFPPLDGGQLRAAMRVIAGFGGLLLVHAEDGAVVDALSAGIGTTYTSFLSSRPPLAETNAIDVVIQAVRETGCRTHIVHLSSAAALPQIRAAKAEGLPLTVETCPHYLTLTAEQIPDGATAFKCCPPIRDQRNREHLWAALRDGDIDCVVSDHSPSPAALKHLDLGDFGLAWGGIASLQLALPAMWTEASTRGVSLARLCEWMARRTAALVGLPDRGAIAVGNQADLVVFAPDETFRVDPEQLLHRHAVTAYAGAQLRGVVRQTLLAGVVVFPADPDPGPARGHLLLRAAR